MKNAHSPQPPAGPSRFVLLGLPYDQGSSFLPGPAKAPGHIRCALFSPSSNLWSETGVDIGRPGILADAGDLDLASVDDPLGIMESAAADLAEGPAVPVFLGGDHLVTYPVVRGLARRYPQLSILHFDAHPDLYDELDGNRYSHACPFARIMEEGLADRLVQIGIRTMNAHQRDQAARFGVEVIGMGDLARAFEVALTGPAYLSFDLDALDPAFAPGVSHHEPGGLSTRQAIDIIHALPIDLVGADMVELNPDRDPAGISAMAAAKLLKEIMGRQLAGERTPECRSLKTGMVDVKNPGPEGQDLVIPERIGFIGNSLNDRNSK